MKIVKISQMVDMTQKRLPLTPSAKNKIQKEIHSMGDHFDAIPLRQIQDILAKYNIHLVDEDGSPWSGFLIGGKDCGEDGAEKQHATFNMALTSGESTYLLKCWLTMSWCKLGSNRWEVIKYIS